MRRSAAPGILCLLLTLGCAPPVANTPYPAQEPDSGEAEAEADPVEATPAGVVRFHDRAIDLRPFLAGFPYRHFDASIEHGELFYLDAKETYLLKRVALPSDGSKLDLAQGEEVTEVDWSTRSLWGMHHIPARKQLWLHADEKNDERMNLWTLDTSKAGAVPVQVTDADYVYSVGFSADDKMLAYLPRTGTKAPFSTCLRVRELDSGKERELVCDDPKLKFTWGSPVFSPDNTEVYFNAQVEGDRKRVQLVRVKLDAKRPRVEILTDRKVSRSSPSALDTWVGDRLLFTANDDGYRNLFAYDRKRRKLQQLTHFVEDVQGAVVTDAGVLLSHGTPAGSTLELVDPKTGRIVSRGAIPGKVGLLDGHGTRALWTHAAPDVLFELDETTVATVAGKTSLRSRRLVELDPQLSEAVVQCQAQAVQIPTFDVDPKTGKPRVLHAFLLRPKQGMKAEAATGVQPLGMLRSFYGGDNSYNRFDHIMCAAGVTLLSTSVRGSSGFGKDFYALNDRDLGGDEIIDLFYAARWLEKKMGWNSEQIGVYGRSHGGYATMRAMTFDPATNGRNESYSFGFGLGDAGFSDIEAFYKSTNIPDWVVLEAGDPTDEKDLAQIRERSPVHHVERLQAPLFLLHGEADWRVPVEGSRAFAQKAKSLGKAVTYREVAGQGHHVEGIERVAENYQARFDFLMSLARAGASDAKERGEEAGK
jgi:dipeptidyl aminopeptidase/acylaminoacyl peptidase